LGLATGSSPIGIYQELIRLHKEEKLDFSKVRTFNLDEYEGLSPDNDQSYAYFMHDKLFKHINIPPESIRIPKGIFQSENEIENFCQEYEEDIKKAGGIDIQLLGIGSNGHLAFNEPGSEPNSRTRRVKLEQRTRQDNARFFDHDISRVPSYAISMGLATLMDAKELLVVASSKAKAEAIYAALHPSKTETASPATYVLQSHPCVTLVIDKEAAPADLS